ncbi:MAG: PQQ-dependent sugar dehydrogenase, partial [Deltaproteobacteria bacterium]|nr:PQQ-dependent sugar dehydrogenase [Deltaproteobacteria bacterium]
GDGGDAGDPNNFAQNPDSLLGKMLRIAVDGDAPYSVPLDNPFVSDEQVRDKIWALGLRNPWRFSFDRSTGDLFIGDVGQYNWEEIDYQPVSSTGGENYGWLPMEGNNCFNPSTNCNDGSLTLPVLEYGHDLGCSVTGGYRYRGKDNPLLSDLYIYGDFCSGRIWGAKPGGNGNWSAEELLDTNLNISTFGEDQDGELYVAHRAAAGGTVYRIVQTAPKLIPGIPLLLLGNE